MVTAKNFRNQLRLNKSGTCNIVPNSSINPEHYYLSVRFYIPSVIIISSYFVLWRTVKTSSNFLKQSRLAKRNITLLNILSKQAINLDFQHQGATADLLARRQDVPHGGAGVRLLPALRAARHGHPPGRPHLQRPPPPCVLLLDLLGPVQGWALRQNRTTAIEIQLHCAW